MSGQEELLRDLQWRLDNTDESDWPIIHRAVRDRVRRGEMTKESEQKYAGMVNELLMTRLGDGDLWKVTMDYRQGDDA